MPSSVSQRRPSTWQSAPRPPRAALRALTLSPLVITRATPEAGVPREPDRDDVRRSVGRNVVSVAEVTFGEEAAHGVRGEVERHPHRVPDDRALAAAVRPLALPPGATRMPAMTTQADGTTTGAYLRGLPPEPARSRGLLGRRRRRHRLDHAAASACSTTTPRPSTAGSPEACSTPATTRSTGTSIARPRPTQPALIYDSAGHRRRAHATPTRELLERVARFAGVAARARGRARATGS